ncbi:MAG: phenylacetate--CoA ligase family protein [Candidatus Freyarchaeota archaeon]
MKFEVGREYWNPTVETMKREEIKDLQAKKMRMIISHAYTNSPFYRDLWKEAGVTPEDIKTLDDLVKKAPLFRKDDVRDRMTEDDPFGGLLSAPMSYLVACFASTGTTGTPTFYAYTKDQTENMTIAETRNAWMVKLRPGMRYVIPGGPWHWHSVALYSAWRRISPRFYTAGMVAPITIQQTFDAIMKFKPHHIFAVLDVAFGLNEEARKRGIEPSELFSDLLYARTGHGEPMTKALFDFFKKEWGIEDAFDGGGIGEGMMVCCDCYAHSGQHVWEDMWHIDLVDPDTDESVAFETGERGEYVVTNLHSMSIPYVRCASEDYCEIYPETCECGRTHMRMRITSRTGWILDIQGKRITPYDVRMAMEEHPETREAAFTIDKYAKKMDVLKIRASYNKEITKDPEELKERLQNTIKERLGVDAEITWVDYSQLPVMMHKILRITDLTKA